MDKEPQKKIRESLIEFFTPPNRVKPTGQNYFDENIGGVVDKLLEKLHSLGCRIEIDGELPLISRERAKFSIPETDCSGRKYTPDEREDLVRTIIDGAETQRDKDKYDSGWKAVVPLIVVE